MHQRNVGGLNVSLDDAALREYEADADAFEAPFAWAVQVLSKTLERHSQCPVFVHGRDGCWQWGAAKKLRDDQVDLGDSDAGIQFAGNMLYERADAPDGCIARGQRILDQPSSTCRG